MAISSPILVTAAGKVIDAFFVQFDGDSQLFVLKAPRGPGFPIREIETMTTEEIVAAVGGAKFIPHEAANVEKFDQGFHLNSTFRVLGGVTIVRFFWSRIRKSGARNIFRMDYDLGLRQPGPIVTLPFQGDDPFIMDASKTGAPLRVYLVYVTSDGKNAFRQSQDQGITWSDETLIDDDTALDHIRLECNFDDPDTDRDNVQVVQLRT